MKTVNDIRSEFLNFFAKNGHEIVASSPLVPQNDPTLMFANSGMVQFKNVFTGAETRPYKRAATAQKCVRAGGKHNDLENVGYTARHHTFFEMMGNFSFGDYFKEEAISLAWELITKNFAMPKDKLLVTVYSEDDEAAKLWKKIAGFSDDKIIRISTNDNFWMMGDHGPCGPCSEVFLDQGDKVFGGPPGSADQDGDRFIEFWNLVFMQFEQEPDGQGGYNRKPLPKPSIDTGMGLERMAMLLQGKDSVYGIDLLSDIILHSADLTGVSPDGEFAPSHRVIADHLRAACFLIADGVLPSNEGRGYVVRRIMRRGMRHAHLLGAPRGNKEPWMYRLIPTLLGKMGDAYPELRRAESLLSETLRSEEERFKRTLERGLKILDEETAKAGSGKLFPGDVAFKLYDTFGFPLDLTQDALKAKGISVDTASFEANMERQKAEARKNWSGSGDAATETLWFEILEATGPTEFLGYETLKAEGMVRALVVAGKKADEAKTGDEVRIVTNQTPFYGESGGQVGDHGVLVTPTAEILVTNTKKLLGKLFVHVGKVKRGKIKTGESVEMRVDTRRRGIICANHSATHLLHEALHKVLGDHVTQKGSLQDEQRTRFDISHSKALSADEMTKIEQIVNDEIRANSPVTTRIMGIDDARASGAMALFGEKYDDEVRVVSMGTKPAGANKAFSVELCGGTHVKHTGEIGLLKIIGDSALSAGVRRLEALTGENALRYFEAQESTLRQIADMLKTSPAEAAGRVKSLAEDKKALEREVSELRRKVATGGGGGKDSAAPDIQEINGVKFIGRVLENMPAKDLKPMIDDFKKKIGSGVIALVSTDDGKASIAVGVTSDLTGRINAVELVKIGAEALGGRGGGGRPDMAQAGGPDVAAAGESIKKVAGAI
ncbi:MAG: alanine--tRNA ligase [Alphaproteobacteria bacterium]